MQEPWIILDRQALNRIPEILLRGTKSHLEWGGVSFRINNTTRKAVPTKPSGNTIPRDRLFKEKKSKYIFKLVMTLKAKGSHSSPSS